MSIGHDRGTGSHGPLPPNALISGKRHTPANTSHPETQVTNIPQPSVRVLEDKQAGESYDMRTVCLCHSTRVHMHATGQCVCAQGWGVTGSTDKRPCSRGQWLQQVQDPQELVGSPWWLLLSTPGRKSQAAEGSVWLRLQAELGRVRSPAEGLGQPCGHSPGDGQSRLHSRAQAPLLSACASTPPLPCTPTQGRSPDHSKGPILWLPLCARAPRPTPS